MKAGLNALTLHILIPAEAVLVLLLCLSKIVLLHDMGAIDLQRELLSNFRTWITSPENPLKNNVLENKVADRAWPRQRGAEACQQCPPEAVQLWTQKHLASLSCLIVSHTLFHLVPKDSTLLHTNNVNGVWMQSGTEQGDLNTLASAEGLLLFLDCSVWERGVSLNEYPRLCLKLVTRWEVITNGLLVGLWGWSACLKIKEKQSSLQWAI